MSGFTWKWGLSGLDPLVRSVLPIQPIPGTSTLYNWMGNSAVCLKDVDNQKAASSLGGVLYVVVDVSESLSPTILCSVGLCGNAQTHLSLADPMLGLIFESSPSTIRTGDGPALRSPTSEFTFSDAQSGVNIVNSTGVACDAYMSWTAKPQSLSRVSALDGVPSSLIIVALGWITTAYTGSILFNHSPDFFHISHEDPAGRARFQPNGEIVGGLVTLSKITVRWKDVLNSRRTELIGDASGAARDCLTQAVDEAIAAAAETRTIVQPVVHAIGKSGVHCAYTTRATRENIAWSVFGVDASFAQVQGALPVAYPSNEFRFKLGNRMVEYGHYYGSHLLFGDASEPPMVNVFLKPDRGTRVRQPYLMFRPLAAAVAGNFVLPSFDFQAYPSFSEGPLPALVYGKPAASLFGSGFPVNYATKYGVDESDLSDLFANLVVDDTYSPNVCYYEEPEMDSTGAPALSEDGTPLSTPKCVIPTTLAEDPGYNWMTAGVGIFGAFKSVVRSINDRASAIAKS